MMKTIVLLFALSVSLTSNAEPTISKEDSARIVRAASRLTEADPSAWTFMVVTETSSKKYVQFSAENKAVAFDFPVLAALKVGTKGPARDADCSQSPPAKREDEIERRYLTVEEEARLRAFLSSTRQNWRVRYCLSETKDGRRVGYNISITGKMPNPRAVPPFIELVFKDVYQLSAVRSIEIETDE